MSVAACLAVYGFTVAVVSPHVLRRLTQNAHVPRLGVAAWLTAIGSVLTSWLTAAVMFVVDVTNHWKQRGHILASCLAWLDDAFAGDAGFVPQLALLAVATAAAAAAGVMCVRLVRTLARVRARSHNHAQSVRLVGHRTRDEDVVIVDATKPAAYCVSGRPPAIVVTSAALAILDDGQLDAVLAHERAHLAGHHPLIVAALRSLAVVFPRLALMTEGAAEVSRLLEMCADDAAVRRH